MPLLIQASKQAPAPSKDYLHLQVSETEIKWTTVPVNARCLKYPIAPKTRSYSFQDYLEDINDIQQKIETLFPQENQRLSIIAKGHIDPLTTLPKDTLVKILGKLSLEDIDNVSQVSESLNKLCESNEVWELLYANHIGAANLSSEMKKIAGDMGWKKFYFSRTLDVRRAVRKNERKGSKGKLSRDNSLMEQLVEQVRKSKI